MIEVDQRPAVMVLALKNVRKKMGPVSSYKGLVILRSYAKMDQLPPKTKMFSMNALTGLGEPPRQENNIVHQQFSSETG